MSTASETTQPNSKTEDFKLLRFRRAISNESRSAIQKWWGIRHETHGPSAAVSRMETKNRSCEQRHFKRHHDSNT